MAFSMDALMALRPDIFHIFSHQSGLLCAGSGGDYNCMTIGWGMMGNVWRHDTGAITVYVSPDRYTWDYVEKSDWFTVSFFPEDHAADLLYLGRHSGRDEDKLAHTALTPVPFGAGVGFREANLSFLCRKVHTHQFELEKTPDFMQQGLYTKVRPHVEIIGFVEDFRCTD